MQLNCEWSLRDIAAYHGCDVPTVIMMITKKVKAKREAEKGAKNCYAKKRGDDQ